MNDRMNVDGVWFVYYTVFDKFEGNGILTMSGWMEKSKMLDSIRNVIYNRLDDKAKKAIGNDYKAIDIRGLNRISNS